MIDYHKYVGYCPSDEKREKPVGGAGGRWDEEKPVENKPVENKPVESGGGDYSTKSSIRSRDFILCAIQYVLVADGTTTWIAPTIFMQVAQNYAIGGFKPSMGHPWPSSRWFSILPYA